MGRVDTALRALIEQAWVMRYRQPQRLHALGTALSEAAPPHSVAWAWGAFHQALGIPELNEMVERYCAATDRTGVPDMNWYFAYNFFRLAGIIQGIKKRVIEGAASSQHAKDMSERVRPLAERAWDFAKKAGA